MRMAVNKNMLVGNYDSAAKILEVREVGRREGENSLVYLFLFFNISIYLKLLLTLELPDELMLSNKWRVCCERGFVDAVPSSDDTKLCFLVCFGAGRKEGRGGERGGRRDIQKANKNTGAENTWGGQHSVPTMFCNFLRSSCTHWQPMSILLSWQSTT